MGVFETTRRERRRRKKGEKSMRDATWNKVAAMPLYTISRLYRYQDIIKCHVYIYLQERHQLVLQPSSELLSSGKNRCYVRALFYFASSVRKLTIFFSFLNSFKAMYVIGEKIFFLSIISFSLQV